MEKIERENVLAVEGKDEKNFFDALLKDMNIGGVQIIDVGGKNNFRNRLSAYLQSEGALVKIKNIGFVRDAENREAKEAFQSICSVLVNFKLPCPIDIGRIIKHDDKKVNIFIMPNNNDCGMLENLCIDSIKGNKIFNCVDSFIKCYGEKIDKLNYNLPKAQILAYLSAQIPIVNSLGLAAQQSIWDFSMGCFNEIKRFISELFI